MLTQVESVDALWLVSVSASVLDFVAAFRRYADRQGIFIPTSEPLTAGKRGRIAITLADGQIMIEGNAEVVSSTARPGGLHGRAGMTLRFSDLDEDSKQVIAQLEKARFASKVTSVPENIRARPARLPAGSPTPAINPDEKVIDPAQALALCLIVGNREALSDAARPRTITDAPSAAIKAGVGTGSGKFVMPSIPSPGGTGRIAAVPSAVPVVGETGATLTPRVGSSTSPPQFTNTPITAPVAAPISAPITAPTAAPISAPIPAPISAIATPSPDNTEPAAAGDELEMHDLVAVEEAKSTDEMLAAPTVTVLSPVILPQREPAGAPPKIPTRKINASANMTLRTSAVPAPIQSVSPFLQSDTSPTAAVDDGEVTSTSEIPLPPSGTVPTTSRAISAVFAVPEATFVGMVNPGGRATTADDLAEATSNSPVPTPELTHAPSAPAALASSSDAAAANSAPDEQVLVKAEIAPGTSPGRRHDELNPVTGNWTIALTPAGPETVVREPLAPQFEIAPSLRVGNAPLEISGAVGGRTDETAAHRPVGTSPSIEISDELSQPEPQAPASGPRNGANERTLEAGPRNGANERTLEAGPRNGANERTLEAGPVQSLQNMVARMPPSSTPIGGIPAVAVAAASVDPYAPTGAYQFGDLGQFPPPAAGVAPAAPHFNQFATPAQGLASLAFGAQPAHHDSRAVTDAGTGFFQSEDSAAHRPRYQTTGANVIIPEPRSRRVLYIVGGAFAVIAIAIIVVMAMGGSSPAKSTKPIGSAGVNTNTPTGVAPLGSNGSGNAVALDAPIAVVGDAGAGPTPTTLDAAAADATIEEPVPTSTLCTLKLNSDPSGAEVVNDKDVLGVTPFSIDVACDEPLLLKFRKAKWIGTSKTLKPTRKGVSFTARLAKPALSIRVTSTPPGASVTVNGKPAGLTPATVKIAPGTATTIAVSKKGFVPAAKKHTAKASNELVNFSLIKSKTK